MGCTNPKPLPDFSKEERRRFIGKITVKQATDCWPWKGSPSDDGYGIFHTMLGGHDRQYKAHRVAYALHNGPFDWDLNVCHRCDNPICCNPGHLFLGSQADNVKDMTRKGRNVSPAGDRHWHAKLTADQVQIIRSRLSSGECGAAIAREFGVHKSCVWFIKHGRSWKSHSPK